MANWYVRPSGGSGSGTSWTAAWNGLSGIAWASVNAGDTIWVAGGTYTQNLTPTRSGTNDSTRIAIRRARSDSTDCTTANGWSSSFASTITHTGSIDLTADPSYLTISGRTTAAGGTYGWFIDHKDRYPTGGDTGIEMMRGGDGNVATYITFEYIEMRAAGYVYHTADQRAVEITGEGDDCTGCVFSHMTIYDWPEAFVTIKMNGVIYEYLDIHDISTQNYTLIHANCIMCLATVLNMTIRYSRFHDELGEGIFSNQWGGCSTWHIYGNCFYDTDKTIQLSSSVPGMHIINNTFVNTTVSETIFTDGASCGVGSEVRNNLIYNGIGFNSCGTMTNNLDISTPNPFVNVGTKDFHIISTVGTNYPRNAGYNAGTTYNTDPDGITRGGDGTWDIGAYEYTTGGTPPVGTPVLSVR